MKPVTWFTLLMVTLVALAGISQIPLIQDLVTASGYSNAEVFSGLGTLIMFIYVVIAVFEVR